MTQEMKAIIDAPEKHISVIARAGCVDKDTEFFTGKGWKKISEYEEGDMILQFNKDWTAELVKPKQYIKETCETMNGIISKYGVDMVLSDEHRVIYVDTSHGKEWGKQNILEIKCEDMLKRHISNKKGFYGKFITTFKVKNDNYKYFSSDDEIRLYMAVLSDGNIANKRTNYVVMNLKKQRKKDRLVSILNNLKIKYVEYYKDNGYTEYKFHFYKATKMFDFALLNMNEYDRQVLFDEIPYWDGYYEEFKRNGDIIFFTSIKHNADFIQMLGASLNKRGSIDYDDRIGEKQISSNGKAYIRKSVCYRVGFTDRTLVSIGSHSKPENRFKNLYSYKTLDGYKYCFTVDSGMLVLRRNDRIFITGNSGKTYTMLEYVKSRQNEKILFLVYNKEMQLDFSKRAKESNLTNVTISTIHSLAYKWFTNKYGKRNFKNISIIDIKNVLRSKLEYYELSLIKFYYDMYLCSDVEDPKDLETITKEDRYYLSFVKKLFDYYVHSDTIQHNVYLKLYQLEKEKIEGYDTLLLDECLDGDMFVKTDKGFKKIKYIHKAVQNGENIKVLSFNEKKEIFEYKEVIGSKETKDRDIYHLKSEGLNSLYCTENHRILTQRGYVRLDEIKIGKDQIILDKITNQKTKVKLNDDQYQLIIGSYLGDGHLRTRSRGEFPTYHIGFTQSEKQVDYMRMKYTCLNISKDKERVITSGYTGKNNIRQSGMSTTFALDNFIDDCLCDMDARALAIWYMDDGNISYANGTPYAHIDLGDKDDYLVNKLMVVLKENFGLIVNTDYIFSKYKNKYGRFDFRKQGSQKLFQIISKYIHEDLYYKIPNNLIPQKQYTWNNKFKNYGSNFVKSVEYCKKGSVYDITVKDNHNFVTTVSYLRNKSKDEPTGIVVHNCNDHNHCMLSIVENNLDKKIIMVGDPLQNLNSFNYTLDGLSYMINKYNFKQYSLTMSFRISEDVAKVSSKYLSYMYDDNIVFHGNKHTKFGKIDLTMATPSNQVNILCRNKLGGLFEVLNILSKNKNKKFYYVGGLESFGLSEIEKFQQYNGNIYIGGEKFHISELRAIKAKEDRIDPEISKAVSLYDFGRKYEKILPLLRFTETTKKEEADIIIQTAHSSKGLTVKNVYLASDFKPIERLKEEMLAMEDNGNEYLYNIAKSEVNLIYVAITRATDILDLNQVLNKTEKRTNLIELENESSIIKRAKL